jgi:hypothetical protein
MPFSATFCASHIGIGPAAEHPFEHDVISSSSSSTSHPMDHLTDEQLAKSVKETIKLFGEKHLCPISVLVVKYANSPQAWANCQFRHFMPVSLRLLRPAKSRWHNQSQKYQQYILRSAILYELMIPSLNQSINFVFYIILGREHDQRKEG